MRLYLVRHATAADADHFSGPDEDRPLTGRGRDELRLVLPRVAALESPPAEVWTSPLVRAVQTAELVLALWAPGADLHVTRALRYQSDISEIIEEMAGRNPEGPLALVGHEPHLGLLLTALTGGRPSLSMPKAGVARLRYRPEEKPAALFRFLDAPGLRERLTEAKLD